MNGIFTASCKLIKENQFHTWDSTNDQRGNETILFLYNLNTKIVLIFHPSRACGSGAAVTSANLRAYQEIDLKREVGANLLVGPLLWDYSVNENVHQISDIIIQHTWNMVQSVSNLLLLYCQCDGATHFWLWQCLQIDHHIVMESTCWKLV